MPDREQELRDVPHRDNVVFEYCFYYVGHPTRQSAVDAVRRRLTLQIDLRRVKAERELSSDEIAKQGLHYWQVKYAAKGCAPP